MTLIDPGASFIDQLRPASFRGVPFGVLGSEAKFGRRLSVHEYPYRDKPWVEDLGRKTRPFSLTGFLVADSLVYGGGEVLAQRDAMAAAAEQSGSGILIHPTYGELTVSLETVSIVERWDTGRYFDLQFSFIESGDRVFPSPETDTGAQLDAAADGLDDAAADDYDAGLIGFLEDGAAVIDAVVETVGFWYVVIRHAVSDATRVFNLVCRLSGSYGRYYGGASRGVFNTVSYPVSTVSALIAEGAAAVAVVDAAAVALSASFGAFRAGATARVSAAAHVLVSAMLACFTNPADAVRVIVGLCARAATRPVSATPMGASIAAAQAATNTLFRRTMVAALARACRQYQPASHDDAVSLMRRVVAVMDAEIVIAGDHGDDASFAALRRLRAAVIADLQARGASLSMIEEFTFASAMPSAALAWRLYGKSGREPGLVQQVDPIHPLFMPPIFKALAR